MIKRITKGNFKPTIRTNKVVVMDFYADWCGPCKAFNPTLEKLSKEYAGKAVVGKVNIDKSETIANKYNIKSIPTVLYFKDGKLIGKEQGAQSFHKLSKNVDSLLETPIEEKEEGQEESFVSRLLNRFTGK